MSETLDKPPTQTTLNVVGTRPIRPDGADKVTGRGEGSSGLPCRLCRS